MKKYYSQYLTLNLIHLKNIEGSIDLSCIKHIQINIDTVFIDKSKIDFFILNFNYIINNKDNIHKLHT